MIFISILIFILAMSLPFFKSQITPVFFTRIAALAFIYAGALTFNALHIQSIGSGIGIYSGLFQITYYSLFIETFLYVIGAIILLSWAFVKSISFRTEAKDPLLHNVKSSFSTAKVYREESISTSTVSKEYSLIALFSTLGGSFLLSSGDLLSMYLSIELQSFALYILATLYRDSGAATSAGLKYFLLGGLSSCLILLGAALVYTFTGLTSFESIYSLISVISMTNDTSLLGLGSIGGEYLPSSGLMADNIGQGISLGLVLIVVGFLFKIAGAPFHNWSPDVYDESPTNVTIWLTIMPKIAIILFLLELEMGIALHLSQPLLISGSLGLENISSLASTSSISEVLVPGIEQFNSAGEATLASHANLIGKNAGAGSGSSVLKNIFLLSSLLSLIIGTVVGLAQIRIKRLLAYSTISHIGFLLLALAINTEQSTESLIFYLVQYTITNLNTFYILLAFGYIINSSVTSAYTNSDIRFIVDLKGQFKANPVLSLSLAVCLFSMAGIPPFIGFFGKQSVLYSAIGSGYFFMAFVAIVVSVISASYYLRVIKELHSESTSTDKVFKPSSKNGHNLTTLTSLPFGSDSADSTSVLSAKGKSELMIPHSVLNVTNIHSFIIATLTLSILFFVLKPSIILNSTVLLSLSLFNG